MVILCDSEKVTREREQNITDIIGQLLGQKGVILCLETLPKELVLCTRLRYGKISYETQDVLHRKKEWEPADCIKQDLHARWKSNANAQLEIYQNAEGEVRTVVDPEGQTTEYLMKQASYLLGGLLRSNNNKDDLDVD